MASTRFGSQWLAVRKGAWRVWEKKLKKTANGQFGFGLVCIHCVHALIM
jgi:hypothetical protein